jgi:hypothetical protein
MTEPVMNDFINRAGRSVRRRWTQARSSSRVRRLNREVSANAESAANQAPVIFFNASTRLMGLSLNAAYNLIASWAVRLSGVPVVNFVCERGMTRCVLGTNRDDPAQLPPCSGCIAQSRAVYAHSERQAFHFEPDAEIAQAVEGLTLERLMTFTFQDVPLGGLVLPSMRWILRRHTLIDDERTRALYREYLLSAWQVSRSFTKLLDAARPQAVVMFNGMFYPEAVARWTAWQRNLRVISHEVGLRPYTAYFTPGDATAYPIDIPDSFELSLEQNQRLDAYLETRMQGNFSMAGIRFWPEMRGLDESFLSRAAQFCQIVPVFTNVIFDTSQPHSNVVFEHMFAWLDMVLEIARAHPETLFVIRAHPDEARPGKESRESVASWVEQSNARALPNVMFVPPQEYFSSYELIQRSKFVMVYNSTIGLEASLMGAPVLCAGKARFTQIPTVFFPPTQSAFRQQAEDFLTTETIDVPDEFRRNARRFLYYQLYRTSLPFDAFIEDDGIWNGYVQIKNLDHSAFDPKNAPVLQTIVDGILNGSEFLLDE